MKRFLFYVAMLFCVCMTINAQGLKTYSGDFSIRLGGFPFHGKATYTYKNADDGTRIYEGNFNFIDIIRPNVCYYKVVGKYHNDLKSGLWTYTNKSIGTTELLKVHYTDGLADGIYEYSKVTKNVTKMSFKGIIKNGVPIGPVSGKLSEDCTYTGQTDENGLPDGLWKSSSEYGTQYEKWEHGVLHDAYFIENSTGDKSPVDESHCINVEIGSIINSNPYYMEKWINRGCYAWDGTILSKRSADEIRASVIKSDDVDQLPKTDYGGYANDEEFIRAKSTIPNILYKLNGTKVDCIIDKQGNVTDIEFTQAPKDPAVAKELERCLGMLKYKPAIYKGLTVYCKWGFWYDGNKSLLPEETNEQTPDVEDKKEVEDKVYTAVEQMPCFPGGQSAMNSYLSNNLRYPEKTANEGIQRVIVAFIVEKDGSISNVEIERSVERNLDDEALRVVKNMPKWTPGKQNGSEVRVKMVIPITFRIN